APQDAHAERMKGRKQRRSGAARAGVILREQRVNAALHLARGLVGESDGEDVFRSHADGLDQVRAAVSDDARLAAARAGKDQHGALDNRGGFALLRVEGGEVVCHRIRDHSALVFQSRTTGAEDAGLLPTLFFPCPLAFPWLIISAYSLSSILAIVCFCIFDVPS